MLEISPETMAALEAEQRLARRREFHAWWKSRADVLPPLPPERLDRLWDYATQEAASLGIDEDDPNQADRVALYAAAFALMGELNGHQYLLTADILFGDAPKDERLLAIASLARSSSGAR